LRLIFLILFLGKFFAADTGQCVVQFLSIGGISGDRRLRRQLATVGTAVAAFYLPVTIMAYLYYRSVVSFLFFLLE
jgi:hypothetical protein